MQDILLDASIYHFMFCPAMVGAITNTSKPGILFTA